MCKVAISVKCQYFVVAPVLAAECSTRLPGLECCGDVFLRSLVLQLVVAESGNSVMKCMRILDILMSESMILASTEGIYGTLRGISIPELVGDAVSEPVLLSIALQAPSRSCPCGGVNKFRGLCWSLF